MSRESAIDIHLESFDDLLEPWRRATIEVANKGVPPHITLLYPWCVPISNNDIEVVHSVISQLESFEICFTHLSHFAKRVIYLALDETSEKAVKHLMQTLFRAFPETPPYGGQFPDPLPHLTVAKVSDDATFEKMMEEILQVFSPRFPMTFWVNKVSVIEGDEEGYWKLKAAIPLAKD